MQFHRPHQTQTVKTRQEPAHPLFESLAADVATRGPPSTSNDEGSRTEYWKSGRTADPRTAHRVSADEAPHFVFFLAPFGFAEAGRRCAGRYLCIGSALDP